MDILTGLLVLIGVVKTVQPEVIVDPINKQEIILTHAENVYIHALEWCESRAKNDALNPKDLDGTASYSNFQWKPTTFKGYAIKYKVLPDNLEIEDYMNWMYDYEISHTLLTHMIKDKDVRWDKEFPGCVKKLGYPPKY